MEVILRYMHPGNAENDKQKKHFYERTMNSFGNVEDSEGLDNEFLAAIENFGKQITRKWDDIMRFFNCVDDDDERQNGYNLIMSRESYLDMTGFDASYLAVVRECPSEDSGDSPIAADPLEDVRMGTLEFVNEIRPLIQDISALIEEFNMDDPSRV